MVNSRILKILISILTISMANSISAQTKKPEEKPKEKNSEKLCIKGDYDCLVKGYDLQIKENPSDATLYYNRGEIYSLRGNYSKSI